MEVSSQQLEFYKKVFFQNFSAIGTVKDDLRLKTISAISLFGKSINFKICDVIIHITFDCFFSITAVTKNCSDISAY